MLPPPLKIAVPLGHMQPQVSQLLRSAGMIERVYGDDILELPSTRKGYSIILYPIKASDVVAGIDQGWFDLGVTGLDWLQDYVLSSGSQASSPQVIHALPFGKVTIVLAAPKSTIAVGSGVERKLRIVTKYVHLAAHYAAERYRSFEIIKCAGRCEAFPPESADLVVDSVETGRTIRDNGLVVVDQLLESTACLIGKSGSEQVWGASAEAWSPFFASSAQNR